ncbi:hypothetical protein N7470_004555 [Penicillium chermesinum]|nr:hypothetical protein N7470_004555 [Penicillium chermesinum]
MTVENPKDVLHTVNTVTQALCIPLVSLFVALRFYTRIRFKQALGVEDCESNRICFEIVFEQDPTDSLIRCLCHILVGKYGGGYNIDDVSEAHQTLFKKFCYVATTLYCPMALSVKIALLAILTRIFSPYRGKVWFIYIFLACLCCYYLAALIVKIRICDPIPMYWLGPLPGGSCLDQRAALIADSVISMVSDTIILILPLPLTWSLQMSRNRKLRVIGLLSAGGLATGFSVYRLVLVLSRGSSPNQTIVFICVILSGSGNSGLNFGDQSHLITFAGAPEGNDSLYRENGIRKTVAMEQTVESADRVSDDGHSRRS